MMKKMVTKTKEKKKLEETEEKRANEELRRNEKKNRKKERRDLTFTVVAGVWSGLLSIIISLLWVYINPPSGRTQDYMNFQFP